MRALLVTFMIAGLLAGCAPYRLPGETAEDAFLRHESQRRSLMNAVSIMQQHDASYRVYNPPSRGFTCQRDWGGGNTVTCQ